MSFPQKEYHQKFMRRALELAEKGVPKAFPNPLVGCVIVHREEIVAEGFHEQFGGPHAEVNAIHSLTENIDIKECTLYVNLEPCSHYGKTPPCADLIISKGFKCVVIANHDPNPMVTGKGIEKLKSNHIEVIVGVLSEEGEILNRRFFTFHQKHRPYVILKWAQSVDGFISRLPVPVDRKENSIGDDEQQKSSHQMRAIESAILVGKNTVIADDPQLTTRFVDGKNPVKIMIDPDLEIPVSARIFDPVSPLIIINKCKQGVEGHIRYVLVQLNEDSVEHILSELYNLGIYSLIVEGGAFTLQQFLDSGSYDEVKIYTNAELHLGSGVPAPRYSKK